MTARTLDDDLYDLSELSREQLVGSWNSLFGCDPPKGLSIQLIIHGIAYEMQAKRFGGLRPTTIRKLQRIAEKNNVNTENVLAIASPASCLDPGATLVREWNGVTHTVIVTEDGFKWRGKRYSSLSEIAREITGARWSGPRFFGLNGRVAS